jgi:hypothetical protein
MVSLPNLTQSLTSQSLTVELRYRLIQLVSERYLDSMDVDSLVLFFLEVQREYLQEYTDEELLSAVDDVTDSNEYEEILNELG